ncbi:hypothetical protein TWF506_003717 [Arthrobotrys conoides]|uniref:F-box domain-containing protein n=1 Tax=Arthrobotrys conoides TaxID=74498 RepID=A0AAN8RK30_9PEZI
MSPSPPTPPLTLKTLPPTNILSLPVEIHLEILKYLDHITDLIPLTHSHPYWCQILETFKSLEKDRYTFLSNGIGIHNLLIQSVGEDILCEVDSKTLAITSLTYKLPHFFALNGHNTKIQIPLDCQFLDEPVIYPGSLPPNMDLWKYFDGSMPHYTTPKENRNPRDAFGVDSSYIDTMGNLSVSQSPPVKEFLYNICIIPDCTCRIDFSIKPYKPSIGCRRYRLHDQQQMDISNILGPTPRDEFTVRQMLQSIVKQVLGGGPGVKTAKMPAHGSMESERWQQKWNRWFGRPRTWVFSFAGHSYTTWVHHDVMFCRAWVLSGTVNAKVRD